MSSTMKAKKVFRLSLKDASAILSDHVAREAHLSGSYAVDTLWVHTGNPETGHVEFTFERERNQESGS